MRFAVTAWLEMCSLLGDKTCVFLFRPAVNCGNTGPVFEETLWCYCPNSVFSDCIFSTWDGSLHG